MKVFQVLLYPLSLVYGLGTRFRNHLFNIQYKPSFHFETTTISVGNLSVGGTGKSPMVEYLIRLLKDDYKVATLSRGYGRKTKGFKIADSNDNAASLGDEPYQFYLKFGKEVTVAVGEERAEAIPEILFNKEETEIILLDDAYQHRTVARDINILLTTFDRPFFDDMLLPAGRLREPSSGAKRADIIIVTKCPPDISATQKEAYREKIFKYAPPELPVFFSTIEYSVPTPLYDAVPRTPQGTALLVSGLANPLNFETYVGEQWPIARHLTFRDHHDYTIKDLLQIKQHYDALKQEHKFILTTEKDMVKFLSPEFKTALSGMPIYYLPIKMKILDNPEELDDIILNSIRKRQEALAGISR